MSADQPSPDLRARLIDTGVELLAREGVQALTLREIARRGFTDLAARAGKVTEALDARLRVEQLARVYLEFALDNPGMYELMFRHDLLESGHLGLRDTSLPLFSALVESVGRVRPDADAPAVAAALWANLHGMAQLWTWGSLQLATGTEDFTPLLRTVLDAHLGAA